MFNYENLIKDTTHLAEEAAHLVAEYNAPVKEGEKMPDKKTLETAMKENEKELMTAASRLAIYRIAEKAETDTSMPEEYERLAKERIIKARTYMYDCATIDKKTESAVIVTRVRKFNLLDAWELLGFESYKHELELLCLRATLATADLTDASNRAVIKGCYRLSKLAEEKLKAMEGEGVDPLSKSQTVNAMQRVIDAAFFKPCDNNAEKNQLRAVNAHWNTFLLSVTRGSKKLDHSKIDMVNLRDAEMFFGDILNGIITNRAAVVGFKTKKEETAPAAENAKAEEKPAKKSAPKKDKKAEKPAPVEAENTEKVSA